MVSLNSNENQSEFLPLVEKEEFLPSISSWITLGEIFLVSTIGVVFTLAAVIKYNVTVKSTGNVRPVGELRIVQTPGTGKVKEIKVKENQLVRVGEPLIILDDAKVQNQKTQILGEIEKIQLQIIKINNRIAAFEKQFVAEEQKIIQDILSSEVKLEGINRDYLDRKIFIKFWIFQLCITGNTDLFRIY